MLSVYLGFVFGSMSLNAEQAGVLENGTVCYRNAGDTPIHLVSFFETYESEMPGVSGRSDKPRKETRLKVYGYLVNTSSNPVVVLLGTGSNISTAESPEIIVAGWGMDADLKFLHWNLRKRSEDLRPIKLSPGECAALPTIDMSVRPKQMTKISCVRVTYRNSYETHTLPEIWKGELLVDLPVKAGN